MDKHRVEVRIGVHQKVLDSSLIDVVTDATRLPSSGVIPSL